MIATIAPQINTLQASKPSVRAAGEVIVVTGGAGYIGSHTVDQLLKAGFSVVVIDDLSAGKLENLSNFSVTFKEGDFADVELWSRIVADHKVAGVVHLAGKIDAAESILEPEVYLQTNYEKTQQLLQILKDLDISNLVFASTAAVYGNNSDYPISDLAPLAPINPYGKSKMLAERAILDSNLKSVALRFFNVAGTDPELNILPQNPHGLLRKIKAVIDGQESVFSIYGDDYETIDGTCIRDFINVVDIARAIVCAVSALVFSIPQLNNYSVFNVGSGQGYSINQILEVAHKIAKEKGKSIAVQTLPRRESEIPISVADNARIKTSLNFDLQYSDLETILRTSLGTTN